MLKPLSVVVVSVILLSSFSFLTSVVSDEAHLEEAVEAPARSATVTTSSFVISPMVAYAGQVITFFANATSDTGTTLTFTIYYDFVLSDGVTVNPDSPVSVNMTGNPGNVVTEFVYSEPGPVAGTYRVRLSIDDGTGAPLKNYTRAVQINDNTAPYFAPDLGSSLEANLDNETFTASLNMSVTCGDNDDDDLTLTWDFGDGTEPVVQTTGPSLLGVECVQNYTWSPDPELWYGIGDTNITYYVNLSLTDGFSHWTNTTTLVRIPLVHNFSPKGNISVSVSTVDPTDVVTIYGNVSDVEGEPLTWTFLFSDSTGVIHTEVYHTGLTDPGTWVFQNTSYVFSVPGNYTVSLYVTDLALPELQVDPDFAVHNVSIGKVSISSVSNSIPEVLASIMVVDWYTGKQDVVVNWTTGVAMALFSIQAVDPDGEALNATWSFGDGSEPAYNESLGGKPVVHTFAQIHEFSASGQYNVSVVITDGRPGHEVLRYKLVNITSINEAPKITSFDIILSNSSYGLPGSAVWFVLVLYDLERDPLEVRWDFGDGSPVEWTNVTSFDEDGNVTIMINHTYSMIGEYKMWVNFTDRVYGLLGYHQESWSARFFIDVRIPVVVREWDWWDYASLGIFAALISLLVLWAVMGSVKRRRIDMMGTTLEEYVLRKQEIERYDERHKGGGEQG